MSIETLTGDEFANLDADHHNLAIEQYDRAIHELAQGLANPDTDPDQYGQDLDKLTSLMTLRKIHCVRLAELEEDETDGSTANDHDDAND